MKHLQQYYRDKSFVSVETDKVVNPRSKKSRKRSFENMDGSDEETKKQKVCRILLSFIKPVK